MAPALVPLFRAQAAAGRKRWWPSQNERIDLGPYPIPVSPKLTEPCVSINHNQFNISF